jgi:hypothetical protein
MGGLVFVSMQEQARGLQAHSLRPAIFPKSMLLARTRLRATPSRYEQDAKDYQRKHAVSVMTEVKFSKRWGLRLYGLTVPGAQEGPRRGCSTITHSPHLRAGKKFKLTE